MAMSLNSEVSEVGLRVQCLCPEISTEGNIGRRALAKFAKLYGISEEAARQNAIIKPMVTAADVGEAVVVVADNARPTSVWRVSGTGLSSIEWVPEDFLERATGTG